MKILTVVDELFHAYGETDRRSDITELITAFFNFAKALIKRLFFVAEVS
jgi:hypothetical protein